MLNFNFDKFDFWQVYDSIKRYYPIGVRKTENGFYQSYSGMKAIEAIIVDNIHNDEHYRKRWVDFTKQIEAKVGKEIIGTTYGIAPSFSSYFVLEQSSLANLTRTKELHFFVSLIGPYYTVIGADTNTVNLDEQSYRSVSYLVVSPENEFTDPFELLCSCIESRFKGYRFLPFEICKQTIDGFEASYPDVGLNTVFHALFTYFFEIETPRLIGNEYFRAESWMKGDYVDEGHGWTMYPPTE